MMPGWRSLCQGPDSGGDSSPTNLPMDVNPQNTSVYEDTPLTPQSGARAGQEVQNEILGYRKKILKWLLTSKNKRELKLHFNLIYRLGGACLFGPLSHADLRGVLRHTECNMGTHTCTSTGTCAHTCAHTCTHPQPDGCACLHSSAVGVL